MIILTHTFSDEGARSSLRELNLFLDHAGERIVRARSAGEAGDPILSFACLRALVGLLTAEIAQQDKDAAYARRMNAPTPPTIREVRT